MSFASALHDHALARAHHVRRVHMKNTPARRRDLGRAVAFDHFRKENQLSAVGLRNAEAESLDQRAIASPRFGFVLSKGLTTG